MCPIDIVSYSSKLRFKILSCLKFYSNMAIPSYSPKSNNFSIGFFLLNDLYSYFNLDFGL